MSMMVSLTNIARKLVLPLLIIGAPTRGGVAL